MQDGAPCHSERKRRILKILRRMLLRMTHECGTPGFLRSVASLIDTSSPPSAELLLKEKPLYIRTQSLPLRGEGVTTKE